MTQLWLIRHGQTDWNVEGRYQGQADLPLNATGLAQAEQLAVQLDGERFEALYSSDLLRARQTAKVLAQKIGLPVQVDPRLREVNQGQWEGELFAVIRERYRTEIAQRRLDPVDGRPPGGESAAEVAARVWEAADDIARDHPDGTVLVVSHGLALATLIARADGVPLEKVYTLIPDNAAIRVLSWPPD
jgi:broad specificity phosphatase PhoE